MSFANVLLVEGIDDAHAIRNLLYRNGVSVRLPDDDTPGAVAVVKSCRGWQKLRATAQTELETNPNLLRLGVVADADDGPADRWRSFTDALTSFGGEAPAGVVAGGWTGEVERKDGEPVRAGLWLMPDNDGPGAIEAFAATLVPAGDALWPYADACLAGLPQQRFADKDAGKAHLHTWLAWQATPREPIGRAISNGSLDAGAAPAEAFARWARRLFTEA